MCDCFAKSEFTRRCLSCIKINDSAEVIQHPISTVADAVIPIGIVENDFSKKYIIEDDNFSRNLSEDLRKENLVLLPVNMQTIPRSNVKEVENTGNVEEEEKNQ